MSKHVLFKHFPPPRFLNPDRIGVSFSDLSIKMVKLGSGSSKFPVETIIIPIEPGIVVSGVVIKPEELAKKISEHGKKFHSKYVSFTIPDELTYVFGVSVLVAEKQNIAESVAFTIEENVPLALEETIFDFVPISIKRSDENLEAKLIVTACVKKEVEKIVDMFRSIGYEPLSCLPESQATAEAVVPKGLYDIACIIHARDNRVAIYLVKEGVVQFSTLRSITKSDYEKDFLDEYQKFLEYWSKYDDGANQKIKAVIVCGEFEYAKRIVLTIPESATLKEKPALGNVWVNVFAVDEYMPDLKYETSLSFAGAIGSVIADV